MKLWLEETPLRDCFLVKQERFHDERGFFMEVYREDLYREAGLPARFVQMNHSKSARGVVRGLHFQYEPPMAKLMRVIQGTAYLVAVDIRPGSPTLGQHVGFTLSADDAAQLYAPPGFARGFAVLSETAEIQYFCTGIYNPTGESGILWNDSDIAIDWPVDEPLLSDKDAQAQTLSQWLARPEAERFRYE